MSSMTPLRVPSRAMIVERSMTPDWLSNTYLVAAGPGGDAFLVDAGGPMDQLFAKADEHGLTVTHVLLTHHHGDHVAELGEALERWPDAEVLDPPRRARARHGRHRRPRARTTSSRSAGLTVRTLHTPGHTNGMLSLLVEGNVFTGDTLFKGSVGGVRAPGSTSYADLKHSIMDVLLTLPPETVIRPGHTDPTHGRRRARAQPLRADLARRSTRRATSPAPRSASPPR